MRRIKIFSSGVCLLNTHGNVVVFDAGTRWVRFVDSKGNYGYASWGPSDVCIVAPE